MNKLATLLTLAALTLPVSALAQPDDGPRDRPDRDRAEQRERGERHGDRARPGERDSDRPKKRTSLSVDQIDEALATLRAMHGDKLPTWMQRIEAQAKDDPEEAAKALARFPRIREMMEARKNRPEEFALQSKQGQLMRELFPMVRELKQAQSNEDQDKVDALKPKIRERIEQLFQVRLELKEFEIKRIRKTLAKAEQELADIQADRESLIDEKMDEIMSGKGHRGPREEGDHPDRPDRPKKPNKPQRDDRE